LTEYFLIRKIQVYKGTIKGAVMMEAIVEHRLHKYFFVHDARPAAGPDQSYLFANDGEWEFFEERAAIFEYEAGFSKKEAEQLAYQRVLNRRELFARAS
jgi:hypothetical protein